METPVPEWRGDVSMPVPTAPNNWISKKMTAQELWDTLSLKLKAIIDEQSYSMWISQIKPVGITRDVLTLAVDNDFAQTWVRENYVPLMTQVLSATLPDERREIAVKVESSEAEPLPPPAAKPAQDQVQIKKRTAKALSKCIGTMNDNFTFDEFVVGPSNSWAHAAALAVAQKPGRAYNPLFIYGSTGIGKTHLMQAVGHRILERPGTTVAYISTETLLNEYVNSISNNSTLEFRNKYRGVDALLIDDIQFMASKEGLQEEFFHTFNALYTAKKQIIITSDRPASEIAGLQERLVSRFNCGMTTQVENPNFETRLAILRYKQSATPEPLSDEIQTFIAENVQSNVRNLEGAMQRAMAYRDFSNDGPLTVEKLRYLIRDLIKNDGEITLDSVKKAVCEFFNVPLTDLLGEDRKRSVAIPRQIAMYLSRRLTRASYPDIGASFEKTHGTVVHACQQIHRRLSVDKELHANINAVVVKLGQDPAALEMKD